jgi:hypothetical protein
LTGAFWIDIIYIIGKKREGLICYFLKIDKKGERSMNKEEKVSAADDFFLEMEKQARTGETIVKVIVISSFVFLAADLIFSIIMGTFTFWSIIKSILWAFFYCKLYDGRAWAKWLYIISCAVGIVILVILFVQITDAGLSI